MRFSLLTRIIPPIVFSGNNIGDLAGAVFFSKIGRNNVLRSIIISQNDLSTQTGNEMAKFLAVNTVVTTIDISSNGLTDTCIESIAEVLNNDNRTLKSFDISHNNFGANGTSSLFMALENCYSLTNLDLSGNNLSLKTNVNMLDRKGIMKFNEKNFISSCLLSSGLTSINLR